MRDIRFEQTKTSLAKELRNAVARWEYEGGAGVSGPHEGFAVEECRPRRTMRRPSAATPQTSLP